MDELLKPIFIVGVPRSGTTLLNDLMSFHEDLAFFSQNDLKEFFPNDFMKFVYLRRRIFETRKWPFPREGFEYRITPTFEVPHEFNWFWNKWITKTWATGSDVSSESYVELRTGVIDLLKRKNKSRFISKNPSHSIRMEYLHKVYPEAIFVNIVRDPRSVVTSMTRAGRKFNNPKWYFGLSLKNNNQQDFDLIERHAKQWNEVNSEIQRVSKLLPDDKYFEIKYEELVSNPKDIIETIFDSCQLDEFDIFDKNFYRVNDQGILELISGTYKNMNIKAKQELTDEQLNIIEITTSELMNKFQYV